MGTAVHPRVGGEQDHLPGQGVNLAGSSPRGRGTDTNRNAGRRASRFIPAWAGNRPRTARSHAGPAVHPRVGGEQIRNPPRFASNTGSSPRGRGTALRLYYLHPALRFIPAWAGNSALTHGVDYA